MVSIITSRLGAANAPISRLSPRRPGAPAKSAVLAVRGIDTTPLRQYDASSHVTTPTWGTHLELADPKPQELETADGQRSAVETAAILQSPGLQSQDVKPVHEAQRFTDSIVRKVLLWLFPAWIRPNHLTVLRFILTPVVLLLLYYDLPWWALGIFVVAICTDFIDGTMARTRGQITPTGIIIDPIADKLLVGSVLAWLGWDYLVVKIILIFIALELILTAVGIGIAGPGQRARPSNAFGKGKMVVQSVALVLFIVASILDLDGLLTASLYLLWVALALAALSGITHVVGMSSARRGRTKG